MKLRFLFLCFFVTFFIPCKADDFANIEEAFKDFSKLKRYDGLFSDDFKKKIDQKNSFVELTKNQTTVQFGRYEARNNEFVYVFNYFSDSSYNKPGIALGCYKYINKEWVEVTDLVMPVLSFYDFYGTNTAPPKTYVKKVQFRFILHKSKLLHIVIEPNINKEDPKFDRIFDQRKYAAAQTKWNRIHEKFEIVKWLK